MAPTRFARITRSQSGSNFFHPPEYATWRSRPSHEGLVEAPRRMALQR